MSERAKRNRAARRERERAEARALGVGVAELRAAREAEEALLADAARMRARAQLAEASGRWQPLFMLPTGKTETVRLIPPRGPRKPALDPKFYAPPKVHP